MDRPSGGRSGAAAGGAGEQGAGGGRGGGTSGRQRPTVGGGGQAARCGAAGVSVQGERRHDGEDLQRPDGRVELRPAAGEGRRQR